MTEQMQNRGSVVVVESPEYDEYWQLPLTVGPQTKGYLNNMQNGTKLDWRSSLLRRVQHEQDDEFLREV